MSEVKRFYWLKLKENFFEDDTIQYIEEQTNGILYSNFYLKLCLKSLKSDGRLIRVVGNTLIPYDIPALSRLTGVPVDTVRCAMALFQQIGLISTLDSGELFLQQINELVGSETNKAEQMRKSRAKKLNEGNNVTPMLPDVTPQLPERYPEIEKDIDIDKDIDIESDREIEGSGGKENKPGSFLTLGSGKNVLLTPSDFDKLKNFNFYEEAIERLSADISKNGDNGVTHYQRLLEWCVARSMQPQRKNRDQSFEDQRAAAIAKLRNS